MDTQIELPSQKKDLPNMYIPRLKLFYVVTIVFVMVCLKLTISYKRKDIQDGGFKMGLFGYLDIITK